jgi:hypothetical protein
MSAVYATLDGTVTWSGGRSPLYQGEVWDDSAPLVVERPDLFTTNPSGVE